MSIPTLSPSSIRSRVEELVKKRFFFIPSFGIYGGVAGLYDYGPPGCALQSNILSVWRSHFIFEEQMLEVDTSIMTLSEVLKTSGHVDRFTDYMVRDAKTGDFFRADHLVESRLEKMLNDATTTKEIKRDIESILAQIDGLDGEQLQSVINRFLMKSDLGNDLTNVQKFNLMFGTEIGPTGYLKGFLRPETAQGMFTNFKKLLECNNEKMPFATAQIGKSFRNEISPRSGLLRVREFTMAEVEHFVHPENKTHSRFSEIKDVLLQFLPKSVQEAGDSSMIKSSVDEAVKSGMVNNETLGYFLARTALFLIKIGIAPEKLRFRQHMSNEMAHYASDCWDAEILSSYGWIECVGCADRSCYDLSMHSKATGEKLVARERLPAPIFEKVRRIQIDKKLVGQALKNDAKDVISMLEEMNPKEFLKLNGTLTLPSGKLIELSSEMAKIVEVNEAIYVRDYVPAVIEPSFGIGRILYSLLEHVFYVREGDEQRSVLAFPCCVAPIKCLILPISAQQEFKPFINQLLRSLKNLDLSCQVDESSASIGKRYARNDEIGIPFAITIDFQTTNDQTVTVRERDSTSQLRISIEKSGNLIKDLVDGKIFWSNAIKIHGIYNSTNGNL